MIPEHSDNTYLQCLLLEVGFQDVKDEMRKRYEQFRREQVQDGLCDSINLQRSTQQAPSLR